MIQAPATFERFQRPLPGLSGADRLALFDALPEPDQDSMWQHLADRTADRRFLDGQVGFKSRKPKSERRPVPTPAPRLAYTPDEWRRGTEAIAAIPAEVYIPALTDSEPLPGGRVRCPLPDHDDLHPSATYRDTVWYCHVCAQGGAIFQLAAALTGLADRGEQFVELRLWIAERLLGVAA